MRKPLQLFGILIFLLVSTILAENNKYTIRGRVMERHTGKPLIGVNVFLDGTTTGTTTDDKGFYLIKNVDQGNYDLVISMIGYETKTRKIVVGPDNSEPHNFELKEKVYETKSVVVEDEEDDAWQRSFQVFKNLFLGTSKFAEECEIQNKEIIEFNDTRDFLTGYTSAPLIVINNALGFKIRSVMSDFYYDKLREKTWFSLRNFFEEMKPKNKEQKQKWLENRVKAYETSLEHLGAWLQNPKRDIRRYKFTQLRYMDEEFLEENNEREIREIEVLLHQQRDQSYRLSFPYFLRVEDVKYAEESIIKLFYPSVAIDKHGFIKQQHALEVYGYYGKIGLANQLPKQYYYVSD